MNFAVLPVKNPRNAKQRLNGLIGAAQRESLARLMFENTLATLSQARGIDHCAVITSDAVVAQHARRSGALVFDEAEQRSHSDSADIACLRAMTLGATTVMLVPIDVPLVTAADFERLMTAGGSGVAIVPSVDGTGTNALVLTPPDIIGSRFGPGSFRAHVAQAESKSVPVEIVRLPGLMFDIDTPEDITELFARAPQSYAASFLRTACALK